MPPAMTVRERLLNVATVVAVLCALTVAGLRLREYLRPVPQPGASVAVSVKNWRELGSVGLRVGPQDALVTVVEFSDFQCPFCRRAAGELRTLRERYPRDLAVVYRHFPIHDFARAAASAASCADRQGAFQAMHDTLFAQVDSIGR